MTRSQMIHFAAAVGYAVAFGAGYLLHVPAVPEAAAVPAAERPADDGDGLRELRLECERLRADNAALAADLRHLRADRAREAGSVAAGPAAVAADGVRPVEAAVHAAEREAARERRDRERADRRDRVQAAFSKVYTKQADFLKDIDVGLLDEEQRRTHLAYTSAQETRSALAAKLSAGETLSPEERRAYNDARHTIGANRGRERDILIGAIGTSMGMSREDSEALGALIKDIYSTTSNSTKVTNGNSTVISIEM